VGGGVVFVKLLPHPASSRRKRQHPRQHLKVQATLQFSLLFFVSLLPLFWKNTRKLRTSLCCLSLCRYAVCVSVSPPPNFLLRGLWNYFAVCLPLIFVRRKVILPCSLCVCVRSPILRFLWGSCCMGEAYETILLPVCLCAPLIFFLFSMLSASYQRKAGDQFFPELLVIFRSHLMIVHITELNAINIFHYIESCFESSGLQII
jgi:hypothetical protein